MRLSVCSSSIDSTLAPVSKMDPGNVLFMTTKVKIEIDVAEDFPQPVPALPDCEHSKFHIYLFI